VTNQRYLYLFLVVTIIIWGNSFVVVKIAIDDGASPIMIAMARFLVASSIFGVFMLVRRPALPEKSDLRMFAFLALIGVGVYYFFQYYGVQLAGPAISSILVTLLCPIMIFSISYFRLSERMTSTQKAGLLVSAVGSFFVITNGNLAFIENWEGIVGGSFGVVCAVLWAIYTVEGKRLVRKYEPFTATAYVSLIGTAMMAPFALADVAIAGPPVVPLTMIVAALYLGVLCTAVGYVLWFKALTGLTASSTGAMLYAEPVVTVFFAWLLLGSGLGWTAAAGGVLVLVGVLLVSRR
jgi:drug/metabolite transporter (DMT)-like permease